MKQPDKQTVIYCRTASHDDYGFALDGQKGQLVRYAREHGFANPVIYMDNGFSGLSMERPSFVGICRAIQKGQVFTILVKDISRIGRCYIDVKHWILKAEQAGVSVIAIDNPNYFDTEPAATLKGGEQK